jgi:glycosyltransferase involved in cell wall biosynthesis
MNILVFNWRDISHPLAGGAETNIHELAKQWTNQGHHVTLFCSAYPNCKAEETIDGIRILRHGSRFTVYLHAFWNYLTKLRNEKFDVVIDDVNGVPFFTPLYAHKPRFTIIHHLVKDIFFKELKFPFSWLAYAAEQIVMPVLYKKEKVVTVSKSSKDELLKFGLKSISVIYNGIDPNCSNPKIKTRNPSICYVGRIKAYKRLDVLLKLVKQLNMDNLHVYIAGDGDALPHLKELTKQLGLKNVKFFGHVSDEEKIKILQRSWVFVTPSEKEGWGITVIESNACGTPAVAFDVLGLKDSIVNGKTGFLVNNEPELKEKVLNMLSDTILRSKMSAAAFEWSKNFSWDKSAEEFIEAIKK